MIKKLSNQVIVCGYGRVGRRVHDLVTAAGTATVVIETADDFIEEARRHDVSVVQGDAARDEFLGGARIEHA